MSAQHVRNRNKTPSYGASGGMSSTNEDIEFLIVSHVHIYSRAVRLVQCTTLAP